MTLKIQNYTIFLLENNLNVWIRYTSLFLVPIAALHLLFGICNIYTIGSSRFNKIYYFIKPEATQYNKIISVLPPVSIMLEDLLEEFMDLVGDWLPIQIAFATILLVLLWGLRAGCIRNNIKGNENDWVLLTIVIIALIIFAPWGLLFIKACLFNKRFRNVVYDNWFWQTIYAWFIFIVLTSKPGPKGLVPRHLTLRQWIVVWTTIILVAFILPWIGIYLRDYFSWQTRIRFGKKK